MNRSLFYIYFLFTVFLAACHTSKKTVYLKAENETGINGGEEVKIKGLKVGKVDKVILTPDFHALIKLSIDDNILLPTESKFTIMNADLIGTKIIDILPGHSNKYIVGGDTMLLFAGEKSVSNDSLSSKVGRFIDHIVNSNRDDSLVKEVQRLNKQVEELNNELKKSH